MKRFILAFSIVLCFLLLILWQLFISDKSYYLVSVLVLVLSMLPFVADFEHSKHSAGEMTLIAGLIAIAVVSRAVFYLIPQVKPIGAVVAVSGVCLGARRGYIVGAFSVFISNFIFGQGVWTPFQMVGMGMVGLLFGLLFKDKSVRRLPMAIAGFLLTFILYGLIADLGTVLVMSRNITILSAVAVFTAGVPFGLVFGATTAVCLFLFGEAFIKKINRLIVKYDIN